MLVFYCEQMIVTNCMQVCHGLMPSEIFTYNYVFLKHLDEIWLIKHPIAYKMRMRE